MKNLKHLSFIGLALMLVLSSISTGCKKENNFLLSPAQKMEGTWKTPAAVTFYYYTDWCGVYEKVAKTDMKITWIITKKSQNEVDIEWNIDQFTLEQYLTNPPCDFMRMNDPIYLTGTISGSQMDIYQPVSYKGGAPQMVNVGTLSFTTDNMAGQYYTSSYYLNNWGVGTAVDKTLILQRQK